MYVRNLVHETNVGYLVGTDGFSGPLFVVDPVGDVESLVMATRQRPISHILLTGPPAQAESVQGLRDLTNAHVCVHRGLAADLEATGIPVTARLVGGDRFEPAGVSCRVLATPGVSRFALSFLIGGVYLFAGRTLTLEPDCASDLEDPIGLALSRRVIATLADELDVMPGRIVGDHRRLPLGLLKRDRPELFDAPFAKQLPGLPQPALPPPSTQSE